MSGHYDITTKAMIEGHETDWVKLAGLKLPRGARVQAVDSDLSDIALAADKVIKCFDSRGKALFIIHIEFQTRYDKFLIWRGREYNAVLSYRHKVPVLTLFVLLTPDANNKTWQGVETVSLPNGRVVEVFNYDIVRVWEHPAEEFARLGPGLAPLAVLTTTDVDSIVELLAPVLDHAGANRQKLWTASYILAGLNDNPHMEQRLAMEVENMKESRTYQIVKEGIEIGLEKGIEKGIEKGVDKGFKRGLTSARHILFKMGSRKLGAPDPVSAAVIEQTCDSAALEEMADRVFDAQTWADVIKVIKPKRARKTRVKKQ